MSHFLKCSALNPNYAQDSLQGVNGAGDGTRVSRKYPTVLFPILPTSLLPKIKMFWYKFYLFILLCTLHRFKLAHMYSLSTQVKYKFFLSVII